MRKIFLTIIMITGILSAFLLICIVKINVEFPATKEKIVGLNEKIIYDGVDIAVISAEIMDEEEKKLFFSEEIKNYGECEGIIAEINLENNSAEAQEVNLSALIFESGAWKNAIHYMAFAKLNKKNEKISLNPWLEPGEGMQLKLLTFAAPIHMREKQWIRFLDRDIYLTFSLYPEKIMVKLW